VVPYDVVVSNDETAVEEDIQEQAGEIEGEEAPTTACDTTTRVYFDHCTKEVIMAYSDKCEALLWFARLPGMMPIQVL
jgi:hypothetical protein